MEPILVIIILVIVFGLIFYRTFPLRLPTNNFKYVYVENDGSVREVDTEEQKYLMEDFHPNDGARPYIKTNYWQRTPDNKLHGYLTRIRVPWWIPIKESEKLQTNKIDKST